MKLYDTYSMYNHFKTEYPDVIFSLWGVEMAMQGRPLRMERKGSGEYLHIVCDEQYESSGLVEGPICITRSVAMVRGNKKHHVQQLENILKELWTTYIVFI